jgi:hypothetical protein
MRLISWGIGINSRAFQTHFKLILETVFCKRVSAVSNQPFSSSSPTMSSTKVDLAPPIRRVITAHDSKGTAFFASDEILYPVDPSTAPVFSTTNENSAFGVIQIHRSRGFPVDNQLPLKDPHKTLVPLADTKGASVRISRFLDSIAQSAWTSFLPQLPPNCSLIRTMKQRQADPDCSAALWIFLQRKLAFSTARSA